MAAEPGLSIRLFGRPGSAQIDVDPYGFDLQPIDGTKPHVRFLQGQLTVHPATQNTVRLAGRIQLHVLLDAIPAIVLQKTQPVAVPDPV